MNGLKKAAIEVDRKVLADLAVTDMAAFAKFAEQAKASLPATEAGAASKLGRPRQLGPKRNETKEASLLSLFSFL